LSEGDPAPNNGYGSLGMELFGLMNVFCTNRPYLETGEGLSAPYDSFFGEKKFIVSIINAFAFLMRH